MDFIKIPETLKYVFFLHFELFRFGLFPVLAVLTNIYILNVQKYMNKIILYLFILSLSLSLSLYQFNSIQFNSICALLAWQLLQCIAKVYTQSRRDVYLNIINKKYKKHECIYIF